MTIGTVAKRAGVGIETIRFYERKGLLGKTARRESGYRDFDEEAVERLRFIHRAKDLGFSLKEIAQLLALKVDPKQNCSGVKKRAETKIGEIEARVRDLNRIRAVLLEVTRACDASKPIADCPILKCFSVR